MSSNKTETARCIISSALTRKLIVKILRSLIIHSRTSYLVPASQVSVLSYESEEMLEEVIDRLLTVGLFRSYSPSQIFASAKGHKSRSSTLTPDWKY